MISAQMISTPARESAENLVGNLARPLAIGPVSLRNRVFLAPMSGVSDLPFRRLAEAAGAGAVVSEMVASELLVRGDAESAMRAEATGQGPHILQLAGREARWMAEGARAAEDAGADVIDINMGCPAKKVTSGYSGSALMRDLDHALGLIEATVGATSRPVTLKIRLGWDERSINAPELARRAEAAGVRMITVHGRTRCQFYTGAADWTAVAAVRDATRLPLIINGDIDSLDAAERALRLSGADGVMIGRGAYGRPWLPGEIARRAAGLAVRPLAAREIAEQAIAHYLAIVSHYPRSVGLRAARKHLGWYLDALAKTGGPGDPADRRAILTATNPDRVVATLAAIGRREPGRMAA